MREPKVEVKILIEGVEYKPNEELHAFRVGTVLYDFRKNEYVILEDEEDVQSYGYVAPECIVIMVKA